MFRPLKGHYQGVTTFAKRSALNPPLLT